MTIKTSAKNAFLMKLAMQLICIKIFLSVNNSCVQSKQPIKVHITGSVFAEENNLQNCLLLNNEKNVVEALNGNLFMLTGKKLVTPPVSDGCLNGVMRKQILALAKKMNEIEVTEESISAFELQKADELFITNVIGGIQPITKYRTKEFTTNFSKNLVEKLNELIEV